MSKLFLLFLTLTTLTLSAQNPDGKLTFTLIVHNTKGKILSDMPVSAIEKTSKQRIASKTDAMGKVVLQITGGKEWVLNIGDIYNYTILEVNEGIGSVRNLEMTYDYPRWQRTHQPLVDRSKLNIEVIDQSNVNENIYTETESVLEVSIYQVNKNPLKDFPVQLTCIKTQKSYIARTRADGVAYFVVPGPNDYEIDIDGIESYHYFEINKPGTYREEFVFEPTNIKETEKNDTIHQQLKNIVNGTSARTLLNITVARTDGLKKEGENVYLQKINNHKVYMAKTDANGVATFLLPNKFKYMIHFDYQRDVDVVNNTDRKGIGTQNILVTYRPLESLQYPEKFIPTPATLLVKDFNNFLTKQFPDPTASKLIGLNLAWGNNNINSSSKEAILEVGFSTSQNIGSLVGPPLNISIVVDKSGSMEGYERIGKLKEALLLFASKLRRNDIVSLIDFDDSSYILMPAQKVGNGQYLKDMIHSIEAGGGTYIYNGLVKGFEQVKKNYITKGTNRVILLTDGQDETKVSVLLDKSKEYISKGIELSCVGVGEGYNQALLTLLSSTGGGLLHLVGESKDMIPAFTNELNSILHPIAKDVTVELEYNDQLIFKHLYGFPFSTKPNKKVQMDLDNIYPGLNKLALVKFNLNNPIKEIENHPIIIRMTYFDLTKQQNVVNEQKAYLKWQPETGNIELLLENEYKKIYAIAIMNQSLKLMADSHETGDDRKAWENIKSTLEQIKGLYPNSRDSDVELLRADLVKYAGVFSKMQVNQTLKGK